MPTMGTSKDATPKSKRRNSKATKNEKSSLRSKYPNLAYDFGQLLFILFDIEDFKFNVSIIERNFGFNSQIDRLLKKYADLRKDGITHPEAFKTCAQLLDDVAQRNRDTVDTALTKALS